MKKPGKLKCPFFLREFSKVHVFCHVSMLSILLYQMLELAIMDLVWFAEEKGAFYFFWLQYNTATFWVV